MAEEPAVGVALYYRSGAPKPLSCAKAMDMRSESILWWGTRHPTTATAESSVCIQTRNDPFITFSLNLWILDRKHIS